MLRRLYRQKALKVPVRTAFLSIPGRLHRIDEVTDYFTKNEGTGLISKRVIFGPKKFRFILTILAIRDEIMVIWFKFRAFHDI